MSTDEEERGQHGRYRQERNEGDGHDRPSRAVEGWGDETLRGGLVEES